MLAILYFLGLTMSPFLESHSNKISILLEMNIAEYSVNNCDNTAEFIKLMGKYEQLVI